MNNTKITKGERGMKEVEYPILSKESKGIGYHNNKL